MRQLFTLQLALVSLICFAQQQDTFLLVKEDTTNSQKFAYVLISQTGDTITRLDSAKYYYCFSDTVRHFAIVGITHEKDWWAIDKNEQRLFRVYNTSPGEPSPDALRDGMIRIVDDKGKIGYANYKSEIVIQPQFEAASSFYNGIAIIGGQCQQILWCCNGKTADKHYRIECKQAGYINKRGEVLKIGNYSFEEMEKLIDWKPEYEY